jgi:hypothetical protein
VRKKLLHHGVVEAPLCNSIVPIAGKYLKLSSSPFSFPPFDDLSSTENAVIHIVQARSYLKLDKHWLSIWPEKWAPEDGFPLWRPETVPQVVISLPRVNDRGVVDITKFSVDIEPRQPELVDQRHDPMTLNGDDILHHVFRILLVGISPADHLPLAAKLADHLFRGEVEINLGGGQPVMGDEN